MDLGINMGKPTKMLDDPDKFFAKTKVDDHTGCWLWTGATKKRRKSELRRVRPGITEDQMHNRYGVLRIADNKAHYYAHRRAWEFTFGEIPAGLHVLHKCDVPLCCNPDHLVLVTHQENMRDSCAKGRRFSQYATGFCQKGHNLAETGVKRWKNNRTKCAVCYKLEYQKYLKNSVNLPNLDNL